MIVKHDRSMCGSIPSRSIYENFLCMPSGFVVVVVPTFVYAPLLSIAVM